MALTDGRTRTLLLFFSLGPALLVGCGDQGGRWGSHARAATLPRCLHRRNWGVAAACSETLRRFSAWGRKPPLEESPSC
jgi:hypothetical protein